MANIVEYNPDITGLQPQETGIQAQAQAARRIGAFSNQTAEITQNLGVKVGQATKDVGDAVVDYQTHSEINKGGRLAAAGLDGLTASWRKTQSDNPDPNNTSIAGSWREQSLEPWLEDFQKNFTTERSKEWATHQAFNMREHFFKQTSTDMMTRAGDAAVINMKQENNHLANAVADPGATIETLRQAVEMNEHTVEGYKKNSDAIDPAHYGKLDAHKQANNEALTKAYFLGVARRDPDAATQLLNDPKVKEEFGAYINPQEITQVINTAKTMKLYYEGEQRRARIQQKDDDKQAGLDRLFELEHTWYDESGEFKHDNKMAGKIIQDGVLLRGGVQGTALSRYKAAQTDEGLKGLQAKSLQTWKSMINRVGTLTVPEIRDAAARGDLMENHYNNLLAQVTQKKDDDGNTLSSVRESYFRTVGHTIDKSVLTGIPDRDGAERLYAFRNLARQEEARAAQRNESPQSIYHPESDHYIGKFIGLFQATRDTALDSTRRTLSAPPNPRGGAGRYRPQNPGESVDDWLKAIGALEPPPPGSPGGAPLLRPPTPPAGGR